MKSRRVLAASFVLSFGTVGACAVDGDYTIPPPGAEAGAPGDSGLDSGRPADAGLDATGLDAAEPDAEEPDSGPIEDAGLDGGDAGVDAGTCATASCSANATCADSAGGPVCTCKSGFAGDGVTCADIDECQTNNGGCGPRVTNSCTNNVGAAPTCGTLTNVTAFALRCTFTTAGVGGGNCNVATAAYGETGNDNVSILGGQNVRLNLAASDVSYDADAETFSFSARLTNLLTQSLGTIDGRTLDAAGVRLVFYNYSVTAGTGAVSAVNPDGSGTFLGASRPFYRFPQQLAEGQTSASKAVQLKVPKTMQTFTTYFLVATKVQARLVINEIMANPTNLVTESNAEWFEVYNAGLLPLNMQGFKIGDSSAGGDRPLHTIASVLVVPPGGYVTFGNSSDVVANGGATVDYAYGNALVFANSLDAIRIVSPAGFIADIPNPACTGSMGVCDQTNFVEIERVSYSSAALSAQDGISRELKNPNLDNTNVDGPNWASSSVTSIYGNGGRGTPKAQNSSFTP